MLGVGPTLDRNAEDRFGFRHRDVQIATVVRYYAARIVYGVLAAMVMMSLLLLLLLVMATVPGLVVMVTAVLVQGQPLHGLMPTHALLGPTQQAAAFLFHVEASAQFGRQFLGK